MNGRRQRQEGVGVGVGVGVGAERVATTEEEEEAALIPGLPDDIALRCLARLPVEAHGRARAVSQAWRRTLQSEEMWKLRRKLGRTQHFLCLFRDHPAVAQAELFEPSTGTWTCLPLLPYPHRGRFAAVGLGGSVYVIGGYPEPCALFRFDCQGGRRWESLQGMHHRRWGFACAALPDQEEEGEGEGGVIVTAGGVRGGARGQGWAHGPSRAVEVYDVARDKWNRFPDLPTSDCLGEPAFFFPHPHPHPHPHHRGGGGGGGWDLWIMGRYGMDSMYRCFTDVAVPSSVSASAGGGDGEGWHRLPPPTWHHGRRHLLPSPHLLPGYSVAVIHGRGGRETSAAAADSASQVYAAFDSSLYRYDIAYNRWEKESKLHRKNAREKLYNLTALNDELYIFSRGSCIDEQPSAGRRITFVFQVYNPRKRSWRLISTEPPTQSPQSYHFVVMCSVEL